MGNLGVKQRNVQFIAENVLLFKDIIRQWFYFAGLRFLQTHQLSDSQEKFLEEITNFYTQYIDEIENDKNFFAKRELEVIDLPIGKKYVINKRKLK